MVSALTFSDVNLHVALGRVRPLRGHVTRQLTYVSNWFYCFETVSSEGHLGSLCRVQEHTALRNRCQAKDVIKIRTEVVAQAATVIIDSQQ